MKILQINKFFFLKGGAEKYFFDLSELLEKKGHQVFAWSTHHPKNFKWDKQDNFVDYYDFSKKEGLIKDLKKIRRIFWNKEASQKLEKVIASQKPQIAHLHNIFHHLSPAIIFTLKKAKIPMVMTLHDYQLFCPNYKFFSQGKICYDCLKNNNFSQCLRKKCVKNSFLFSLIGALEGRWYKKRLELYKHINVFIAPSLFMKKKAIAAGIREEKIYHLPNFIEKPAKIESKPDQQSPYFLYFGRLSSEKGVDILIKAFLKIIPRQPKWKLKIIGLGSDKTRLKKLANKNKQIEFLGKKTGANLKDLIAKSSFTILPSVWPENLPYSILESFSLQKAVIGSLVGGIPELIKNKENGLLVRPRSVSDLAEKIEWAIAHRSEVIKMGLQAQASAVVEFSSEKHYRELIKIYESI